MPVVPHRSNRDRDIPIEAVIAAEQARSVEA